MWIDRRGVGIMRHNHFLIFINNLVLDFREFVPNVQILLDLIMFIIYYLKYLV